MVNPVQSVGIHGPPRGFFFGRNPVPIRRTARRHPLPAPFAQARKSRVSDRPQAFRVNGRRRYSLVGRERPHTGPPTNPQSVLAAHPPGRTAASKLGRAPKFRSLNHLKTTTRNPKVEAILLEGPHTVSVRFHIDDRPRNLGHRDRRPIQTHKAQAFARGGKRPAVCGSHRQHDGGNVAKLRGVDRVSVEANHSLVEGCHPPLSVGVHRQVQHLQSAKLRIGGAHFYGKRQTLRAQYGRHCAKKSGECTPHAAKVGRIPKLTCARGSRSLGSASFAE